jgi:hypothetical protein
MATGGFLCIRHGGRKRPKWALCAKHPTVQCALCLLSVMATVNPAMTGVRAPGRAQYC